jgi:hypothetical protein
MEKGKITETMREALRADFPAEAYKAHPTKTFLTTLKAMFVVERLNDVLGIGRWGVNTEVIERTDNYVTIKGSFYSLDYEIVVPDQFGGHTTTGTNTEIADGYKSAVTDCISKLASYLEVGISMFKGDIAPPKSTGNKSSQSNDKYKFGKASDESLPWVNDTQITAMIKAIAANQKESVEEAIGKYRWSKVNKEKITKELDK